MNRYVKCIISILLISYVILAVSWSRAQASRMMCTGLNIEVADTAGSRFVRPQEIAKEIGESPDSISKKALDSIDTDSIERTLRRIDKLENAVCAVMTDGSVKISVSPMQPVARVFEGNKSYYINKDGKRISANAHYHVNVPVISGKFNDSFSARDLIPLVYYINSDSTWNALITHIKVDNPNNIILVPLIHGHVINIGNMNDLDDKFSRLMIAYKEVLPVKGWDFYDTLSVKWENQIVATRRSKKLHSVISAVDLEAEKEDPDIGTMLVAGDSIGILKNKPSIIPQKPDLKLKNKHI